MSITDSLYRPAGFACVLPLCVNLNVDLKVAGTLMKINLLFGWFFIMHIRNIFKESSVP